MCPNLASNLPILVEVVVTSMASCPPPITTWTQTDNRKSGSNYIVIAWKQHTSQTRTHFIELRMLNWTKWKAIHTHSLYNIYFWLGSRLTWSMMGEIAAEFTGRSVLKVLMCSSEVESNSCAETRGERSAGEFKTNAFVPGVTEPHGIRSFFT